MWKYLLSLASMIAVYFLHTYGMTGAYVDYWWLDVLTHSLVCFAIAVFLGAFISLNLSGLKYKKTIIISITIIIGVLWEWLEIEYGITGHTLWSDLYIADTLQDFVMDTIGAVIGAVISTGFREPKIDPELAFRSVKMTSL
jgi:hypothetical protein